MSDQRTATTRPGFFFCREIAEIIDRQERPHQIKLLRGVVKFGLTGVSPKFPSSVKLAAVWALEIAPILCDDWAKWYADHPEQEAGHREE